MERGIWKPNGEASPACPRCGSPNTKFCYYNNYSLTQPRYFCKACRRYWTKGGSLRNVPVGGGCRKSRRGKSVRAATDGVSRTNRMESNIQSRNYEEASSSTSSVIDLAAVYANFLNQSTPQPDQYQIEAPIDFSGFQSGSHLPDQDINGFLECGPLFGPGIGNLGFSGGPDVGQKQLFSTGNCFTGINMMNDDDMLLPLPGEEGRVLSEGMVWPNSDVVLQNQLLPGDEQNSELVNGNTSIFGGLNLEAIFRS